MPTGLQDMGVFAGRITSPAKVFPTFTFLFWFLFRQLSIDLSRVGTCHHKFKLWHSKYEWYVKLGHKKHNGAPRRAKFWEQIVDTCKKVEKKSLSCKTCSESFASVSNLKGHQRDVHMKAMSFQCNICQKSCSTKSSLKIHMTLHKEEKRFPCDLCEQSFESKGKQMAHKRSVHELSGRRFTCSLCLLYIWRFTSSAQRVPEPDPPPVISFDTRPDPIQF